MCPACCLACIGRVAQPPPPPCLPSVPWVLFASTFGCPRRGPRPLAQHVCNASCGLGACQASTGCSAGCATVCASRWAKDLCRVAATSSLCPQYLKERKEAAEKKRDERYRKGSSAYRGVSWFKQDGKWRVRIWMPHLGGRPKRVLLGYFADEGEAARTYDRAVIPLHGRWVLGRV